MANSQAHSDMLLRQQQLLITMCNSFNLLCQSFQDLNAQALAQQQTQSPYATAPQHGPSVPANVPAVRLPEINTSIPAASSVQQSLQIQVGPTVSTLPVAVQQARAVANSSTPAASVQSAVVNNSTSGPATAAMNPELVTAVVGSNVKTQIEFRPFPKAIPRITLSRHPRCQELSFFDKQVPVANELVTGQEQSDKEDLESSLDLYHDNSSHPSVNLGDPVPESHRVNNSVISHFSEDDKLKPLLKFCPFSLTYSGKKCPLGEDCTLKKICHANSISLRGCTREGCEFSHEHIVTCGGLVRKGHCKYLEGKGCRLNHDQELRTTVRELIPDHVEYRVFGAKKQVVEEAVTQHDGNTDEVEQPVTQHNSDEIEQTVTKHGFDEAEQTVAQDNSDEVEEIVTQDEGSGEDDFSVTFYMIG